MICSLSFAQGTSSIKGKILDGEFSNEPLLMASVTINTGARSTQTNFRGNFEFNDISAGTYNITVQFAGYEPSHLKITVKEGEPAQILETLYAKRFSPPSTAKISSSTEDALSSSILLANQTR
ncbi:CarboxypepD_reg-like domain-containing protein [Maribacter ulvicola]|uniref:CarboxypepD_reg-like domain-containing protein n=2 Tax=Maribacter ulvicola TaxID=228959 RepID=A0A1N6PY70_9FLAO|nr:CarboxypepD_reg-like domain-containing protein [Maribacter ulvicola]